MADLRDHADALLIYQRDTTAFNLSLFGLLQSGTQMHIWCFLNTDTEVRDSQNPSEELRLQSNLHSRHQLPPPHWSRDKQVIITQATNQTGEAEFRVYLYVLPENSATYACICNFTISKTYFSPCNCSTCKTFLKLKTLL